nr:MAG TPA: hypothetical protein [Crassvirales sp.]
MFYQLILLYLYFLYYQIKTIILNQILQVKNHLLLLLQTFF